MRNELGRAAIRLGLLAAVCGLLSQSQPMAVYADEATAKGDLFHGKLVSMSNAGIVFDTGYTKDKLAIKYDDLQDLKTDGPVMILHGEDEESVGRVLGISDGQLIVGDDPATARRIDIATVNSAFPVGPEGLSFRNRLRSDWRYWEGEFDLGLNYGQATVDTLGFTVGFNADRKKKPTRFLLNASYRYGTQKKKDEEKTKTQDQLLGGARLEYDLTPKWYTFGSGDGEYNGIQHLSFRGIPKAGVGYKIYETKTDLVQVEAGGGWVYEKYFPLFPVNPPDDREDNYFTIAFGGRVEKQFAGDSKFVYTIDYLPAVDDWTGNYLLRNEATLEIPMIAFIAFKVDLLDIYDSTPAMGSDHNEFYATVGLSVGF